MAIQQHLDILIQGIDKWNQWRQEHSEIQPDLREADLAGTNLSGINFASANLSEADLTSAELNEANLTGSNLFRAILVDTQLTSANLSKADLTAADLTAADLTAADLTGAKLVATNLTAATLVGATLVGTILVRAELTKANLTDANLTTANLSKADLSKAVLHKAILTKANLYMSIFSETQLTEAVLTEAKLDYASFIRANLTAANLTGCSVYGISAWNVELEGAIQASLIITPPNESTITVDNLNIAQFIYLLLDNKEIRAVIDTITSKVVLILGSFSPERKAVLEALRKELRKYNYSPILFDFVKPASRDLTETVSTLAHLARFIVVDITDPGSAAQEVATIVPQTLVPLQPLLSMQPLIIDGKAVERYEYTLFEDLRRRYHWVLPTVRYQDAPSLLASMEEQILGPAEQKVKELTGSEKPIGSSGTHSKFS